MSTPLFFPSADDTALFSIGEQRSTPRIFVLDSDPGGLTFPTFDEVAEFITFSPSRRKIVINLCIPDSNAERERYWKLLETKGFTKVIHYNQKAANLAVILKTLKLEAAIGETIVYCAGWAIHFLTKHATGWSVDVETEDDSKPFFKQFNIKRVYLDSHQGKANNAKLAKKFVPYKVTEVTVNRATDATWRFMKSVANGDNHDGYMIDNYDVVGLFAEFKGTSTCIHNGVTKLPFEKSIELDIGDASQLVVNAVRHSDVYLIKQFNMKTKKLRRVRLTIKQHNLWQFEASLTILDRQDVIESGMAGLNLSETPKVPPKTETVPTPPTAVPSVKASITLTSDNRILIEAGPKFTGDAEIPGYFRLEQAAGDPRIQLGVEAKNALKKHPKTVIYDIPGILAAASEPALVKSSWTFETSRDAGDKLLIHLGNDVKTTPVALFGTVIQTVYTYITANLDGDIQSITVCLPEGSSILEGDLGKVSDKIGVPLLTA